MYAHTLRMSILLLHMLKVARGTSVDLALLQSALLNHFASRFLPLLTPKRKIDPFIDSSEEGGYLDVRQIVKEV